MKSRWLCAQFLTVFIVAMAAGCQPANQSVESSADKMASATASRVESVAKPEGTASPPPSSADNASRTAIKIDWSKVDSKVPAVDKAAFNYPFKLDSEPVKAYAEMYQVDNETARYNLTVGMAVNEVLSKVLDQIGTAYVSHELTAGKDSQFIIHTTKSVEPSDYRYVFAEPFAKGLSIPVQVINDGQKQANPPNPHASALQP